MLNTQVMLMKKSMKRKIHVIPTRIHREIDGELFVVIGSVRVSVK